MTLRTSNDGLCQDDNNAAMPIMEWRRVHKIALSDGNAVRSSADFLDATSALTVIPLDGAVYVRVGGATVAATATPANGTSPDGCDVYAPSAQYLQEIPVLPSQTRVSVIRASGSTATSVLVYER
jgi:hypothetical protein